MTKITVEIEVAAPAQVVWDAWTTPSDIVQWNFASDDWCCPVSKMDVQVGGKFKNRMEPKHDSDSGFDFEGVFTKVEPPTMLQYEFDSRHVTIEFVETDQGTTRITESFDAEDENSAQEQQQGWKSILNNFKTHVERDSNT
jgi:uncharacterized protein YndB with AHSA1/START domain